MTGEEIKEPEEQQQQEPPPPQPQAQPQQPKEESKEPAPEVSYKAVVLTGAGGYDKVKVEVRKGVPVLKAGEILVRVHACGLNFTDLLVRQGVISKHTCLGTECAGVVEALGDDVTDRKVRCYLRIMSTNPLPPPPGVLSAIELCVLNEGAASLGSEATAPVSADNGST